MFDSTNASHASPQLSFVRPCRAIGSCRPPASSFRARTRGFSFSSSADAEDQSVDTSRPPPSSADRVGVFLCLFPTC